MSPLDAVLAEVPSPPVTLHGVLTAFQFADWTADLDLGFQALAAGPLCSRGPSAGPSWPSMVAMADAVVLFRPGGAVRGSGIGAGFL
jgi:hypothetical protein